MQPLLDASNGLRDRCARAILDGLPQAMWFIRRHMRRQRVAGLSVPQFRTLVYLDRYARASLSAIAEHLGCSLPAASRMVQKLVGKRLIDRRASTADRRQVALELLPGGRSVLAAARRGTLAQLRKALAPLGEDQERTILSAMLLLGDVFGDDPAKGD